jgi:hypothetical protein
LQQIQNQQTETKSKKLVLPDQGSPKEEFFTYRDQAFGKYNTIRSRRLENAARNLLYELGKQWITLDTKAMVGGARGFVFRDIKRAEADTPRPDSNYIALAVKAEQAALSRRKLIPKVRPKSHDPRVEAAAKVAEDVLNYRLKELDWPTKRDHFIFLGIVTGLGILKSYWDTPISQMEYMDNPDAMACQRCGFALSNSQVPEDIFNSKSAELGNLGLQAENGQVTLDICPMCSQSSEPVDEFTPAPEPSLLVPASLDPETAKEKDYFGRPLGTPTPKGNTALDVVSLFDYYPENSGIDIEWASQSIFRTATPRSIDWILDRYPQLDGKINPEDPKKLMENHPILGDWDIRGRYDKSMDADLYANYAMVYEIYQEKTRKYPLGRAVVIIGNEVPVDDSMYVEVSDKECVPKVCFAGYNWSRKHKELWGKALVDDLISPQNRINGCDAQTINIRERMAEPNVLVTEGMAINSPAFMEEGGGAKFISYNVDPLNPNAEPKPWGGVTIPQGVVEERKQAVDDLLRLSGPQAVEIGEAPKNITTTSGLKLLEDNADSVREPRARAISNALQKIWEHQLQLEWAFRAEKSTYEAAGEDGAWDIKQYDSQALMGQTKVDVEKQSEVEKSIYQSEAVREAIADGLYDLSTLQARKRILELRGLPTDVNEDSNYQIELAKRSWVDFCDEGVVPTIDPSIDDPVIRFQSYATFLLSEKGQRIAKGAGWSQILKKIVGWEPQVQKLELLDQQARAIYGTTNPEQAGMQYQQMQQQFEVDMANWQGQQRLGAQVSQQSGMAAPSAPPPQQPIPPVFLPGDRSDHIYMVWMQLIEQNGGLEQDPAIAEQVDLFLKFRATVEAYRLYMQEKQLQAMTGLPGPAAPGTPAGNPSQNPSMTTGAPAISPDLSGGIPQLGQLNTPNV